MTKPYELYPQTCQEWIDEWDSGESVWSVEMGGLGPAYEQCIHLTAAELLRSLVCGKYDVSQMDDKKYCEQMLSQIKQTENVKSVVDRLGLSGAQWGAACNIAFSFYRRTPAVALSDIAVKDRKILVSKDFPQ